ncbi:MAG TPA: NTP transferase domain-containing protein [Candidatus Binatia bacterium]|nr:NTP transferase domain-containing protein [Candidatus Binatia bacterium]
MVLDQTVDDFTAVILTGGKSSRMGRPKALLPFGNEPLIDHLVRRLEQKFKRVVVVAAPGQELPPLAATVVRDEVAYQGPVGGIYYGLKATSGTGAFVTSCDAPFLNLPLISFLTAQISNHDVVVPYWQGRFQPLHAVYRRSVVPLLEEQLERGELRPIFLYDKVRTRKVGEEEIRRFDPEGLSFLNMNAPDDYAQALMLWQQRANFTHCTEDAPLSCTVELFGVARLLAKTKVISLSLSGDATLTHVLSAVAQRLPVLVGRVIHTDGTDLLAGFACNINGTNFVRDPNTKIHPQDRIFILSADAGG